MAFPEWLLPAASIQAHPSIKCLQLAVSRLPFKSRVDSLHYRFYCPFASVNSAHCIFGCGRLSFYQRSHTVSPHADRTGQPRQASYMKVSSLPATPCVPKPSCADNFYSYCALLSASWPRPAKCPTSFRSQTVSLSDDRRQSTSQASYMKASSFTSP